MQTSALPDLPKGKIDYEAQAGIPFRRWWEKTRVPGTFELKHSRGKSSIPFSCIEPEQIAFARAAGSRDGTLSRIVQGTVGTPDYTAFMRTTAWIVIFYPGVFHIMPVEVFLIERDRSARKSLTVERAEELATYSVSTTRASRTS